jgi:Na+/H+ antiporter NhaD/arsenite permease-like protein
MQELSQILALVIFVAMFVFIIIGKVHRYIPALIGAALTIIIVFLVVLRDPHMVISVLNISQLGHVEFWLPAHKAVASQGVNWQTIIFIAGMMIMVEGMAEAGFFNWMCLLVAKVARYRVIPILIGFMVLSAFLSMFIDSITVMLFMTMVIIELSRLLKFDPVPVIIATIFTSNIGGSATMSGDPPNIIIGTAFGYTFTDFIVNTGLIAWIAVLASIVFFYFVYRKSLTASHSYTEPPLTYPEPKWAIKDTRMFIFSTGIFIIIIAMLISHAQTGLSVGLIGVIAAILTLITAPRKASHILKRIDWKTILFFIGLFICVGGLEETGVLKALAEFIGRVSGGNTIMVFSIILWVSAFASAIIDNIPFAATMVPVIANLAQTTGVPLPDLAWALALGTDIGGNGTPIGASANVVGISIAEKNGHPIKWGRYLKSALPATILVVAICEVYLVLRYG